MTGRTHDLTAFTALNLIFISTTVPQMTLATAIVALGMNLIGGVAPDADQPTGNLWAKLPASSLLGHIAHPFIGAHRHLSHSLLGLFLVGLILKIILSQVAKVLFVDMDVVWWSFMIGYFSHLVVDTFTTEGVPWLLPFPWELGIPPFAFMRIKTGETREKFIIFPELLLLNGWLFYTHYTKYITFLKDLIKH